MNLPTDTALRSLDVATANLTAREQQRATATLDWIVTTSPWHQASRPAAPTPPRRTRRRLLLACSAVMTLVVGSVVVQGLRGSRAAYASWSASPTAVARADLDAAEAACHRKLHDFADNISPQRAKLVLAERRGNHVALLYWTENPYASAPCFARNQPGSSHVDNVDMSVGSSNGPAMKAPAQGFTTDSISQFKGASFVDGAAGDTVTGLTIHAGTFTVHASVANGRYMAWWPGTAFRSGPLQPSGQGGPQETLTYDLTLTAGTVLVNAQPSRHP